MTVCCIEDCGLTADDNVILFEFPTSRLQRKRWLDAINPRSKLGEDVKICSRHFTRRDYEEIRGKTRLKGKVVPSRFGKQVDSQEESSRESDTESNKEEKTNKHNHNDNDNYKSHNNIDKSHNSSDNSNNNSDNSEKSDSDTDYDIKSRKRKRGRPKNSKTTKKKCTKKVTPSKRTRNMSENNEIDNSNNDKEAETTKDNHSDKSHNDVDKSDNQVDNNDKDNRKKSIENGHRSDNNLNRLEKDKSPSAMPADIEDIISKYQIENKKTERQLAAMAQELLMQAAEPVFIEMQVSQGPQEPPSNDCLMLLESVQVEVDPTLMLEARAEDEECMEQIDLDQDSADERERDSKQEERADKKPDQEISLLTSSDEDDVIIQEPKIDTVEVSDETDEDDVPLVKLVKAAKKAQKQNKKKKTRSLMDDVFWKSSTDQYCFQCGHVSANLREHKKHLQTHSKVIQICQDCGFTTCSKSQLYRHRRKHKNDKKHKCPLCNYSARHNMSLIYHLKTHKNSEKEVYMCSNCDFVSPVRSVVSRHKQGCSGSRFSCMYCSFTSADREEVQIHEDRLHKDTRRKNSNDSNSVHSLTDDSTNGGDDD